MSILSIMALALASQPVEDERTPFAPAEATFSFTIDRAGGVLDCGVAIVGKAYADVDMSCEDLKDADVLAAMLGRPLAGLSEVDIRFAFVPQGVTQAAAEGASARRVVSAARLDIAPSGIMTKCTVLTAARFAGFSLDLCDMMASEDRNAFEPAHPGAAIRHGDVIFEAIGFGADR